MDDTASNYDEAATEDDGSCFHADAGCTVAETTFQYAAPGMGTGDDAPLYQPTDFEELGYHSENCRQMHAASSGVSDFYSNYEGKSGYFMRMADTDMLCLIHFDQINIPGIYPGLQKLYLQFDLNVGSTRWESSDQILAYLVTGVEDKQRIELINTAGLDIDDYGEPMFGLKEGEWVTFAYDLSGVTAVSLSIGLDSNSAAEFLMIGNVRYSTSPCKNYGECVGAVLREGYACECEGEREAVVTCADFDNQVCCLNSTAPALATFVERGVVGVFQDRGGDYDFGGCSGNLTLLLYAANCGRSQYKDFWFHDALYGNRTVASFGEVDMLVGVNASEPASYITVDMTKTTTGEVCADPTRSSAVSACDSVELGTDSSASDCVAADPSCIYDPGGAELNEAELATRPCGGYLNSTRCGSGTVCVHSWNTSSPSPWYYAECLPEVHGCMNPRAANYDPTAIFHNESRCLFEYLVVCESLCRSIYTNCGAADSEIFAQYEGSTAHILYCIDLLEGGLDGTAANSSIYISDEEGCFSGSLSDPGAPVSLTDPGHPGWEGMYCGYEVAEECESNPCLNGGMCHDGLQTYTCACLIPFGLESLILDGNCDSRTGPIVAETQFAEAMPGTTTFVPNMVQHELPFSHSGCEFSPDYGIMSSENFRIRMPLRLCSVHFAMVALEPFYPDPCPNGTLAADGVNCTSEGPTCTGTATEVPASCTGTASDGTTTCDLDDSTDGSAACAAGCTETAATTPACDLDEATDSSAECPDGCTDSRLEAEHMNATNATATPTTFNVQLNVFVPSTTWEINDYIHIVAEVGSDTVTLFSTQGVDLDNCTAVAETCAKYVPMTSYVDPKTEKISHFFWGTTFHCDAEGTIPTCLRENAWYEHALLRQLMSNC